MNAFDAKSFLPAALVERITEARVMEPERVVRAAAKRRRRPALTADGRLHILAADHPARRVTSVADAPLAMADRHDYLARIVRVLSGASDGIMATMDLLEELFLIDDFVREAGGASFLDDKLVIVSLNRAGLAGAAWELDDRFVGADVETCRAYGLDGAKILVRLADDDRGALDTLAAAADAITSLNRADLPTFLEPLPVVRGEGGAGFKVDRSAPALARIAGVASALGSYSRRLWLKLPYCDGYDVVARSTTLPILLLGGEAVGDSLPLLEEVARGLAAGATVRGVLAGRNVLFPGGSGDPLAVARALDAVVHGNADLAGAVRVLEREAQDLGRGAVRLSPFT